MGALVGVPVASTRSSTPATTFRSFTEVEESPTLRTSPYTGVKPTVFAVNFTCANVITPVEVQSPVAQIALTITVPAGLLAVHSK